MSDIPCAICEQVPQGKLRQTYITFYVEEEPRTYRLRACKGCTTDARNPFMEWGDEKQEDGSWKIGNMKIAELQEQKAQANAVRLIAAGYVGKSSKRGEPPTAQQPGPVGSTG